MQDKDKEKIRKKETLDPRHPAAGGNKDSDWIIKRKEGKQ